MTAKAVLTVLFAYRYLRRTAGHQLRSSRPSLLGRSRTVCRMKRPSRLIRCTA